MSTQHPSLALTMAQKLELTCERKALRRAASASFMGNFVEWFDYAAYGYLATVIALTFFRKPIRPLRCWRPSPCSRCHLSSVR